VASSHRIGPFALQRPVEEGGDPLVDVLAQLGDGGFRDAGQAHRLDPLVDPAGGNAADPGFLDDGDQCLLAGLACLQKRRKVAALPELGNAQVQRAQPGVERPVAIAVTIVQPHSAAFMATGAGLTVDIGLHEELKHGLRQRAQKIAVAGLLHQVDQRHTVFGHRVVPWFEVKLRNSTLTDQLDDHPERAGYRQRIVRGGRAPRAAALRPPRTTLIVPHEFPPPSRTLTYSRVVQFSGDGLASRSTIRAFGYMLRKESVQSNGCVTPTAASLDPARCHGSVLPIAGGFAQCPGSAPSGGEARSDGPAAAIHRAGSYGGCALVSRRHYISGSTACAPQCDVRDDFEAGPVGRYVT
jgi:hypothetical protein